MENSNSTKNSLILSQYECVLCKDEGGTIQFLKDEHGEPVYDIYINGNGEEIGRKQQEVWSLCSCTQIKKVQRLFKTSQITEQMREKGFKNFHTEGCPKVIADAKTNTMDYFRKFNEIKGTRKNSIALLGKPGCGKTHLLMALANTLIHYGNQVMYFSWIDGMNDIKSNLDKLQDMVMRLQQAEILFIDDLFKGKDRPTEFEITQLFAVINYRYLNHLPILVSSERDTDQMCDIDEAVGSRIHEMCRDYLVIMQGGRELNYRLRGETG